ncbi:unnamed protein product [Lampetra fluviatilis]
MLLVPVVPTILVPLLVLTDVPGHSSESSSSSSSRRLKSSAPAREVARVPWRFINGAHPPPLANPRPRVLRVAPPVEPCSLESEQRWLRRLDELVNGPRVCADRPSRAVSSNLRTLEPRQEARLSAE